MFWSGVYYSFSIKELKGDLKGTLKGTLKGALEGHA